LECLLMVRKAISSSLYLYEYSKDVEITNLKLEFNSMKHVSYLSKMLSVPRITCPN